MSARALLLLALCAPSFAACSTSHVGEAADDRDSGAPPARDADPAPAPDAEPPPARDADLPPARDADPPPARDGGVDCAPRVIARGDRIGLGRMAVGADGRIALAWERSWRTDDGRLERRRYLDIIGRDGASDVVAREVPRGRPVAVGDGYAMIEGSPTSTVHLLDLDGIERALVTMPEGWRLDDTTVTTSGRVLRGVAGVSRTDGARDLRRVDLDVSSSAVVELEALPWDATSAPLARRFERELHTAAYPSSSLVEREVPGGARGPELAWPEPLTPVDARLDVARDRWIVLGREYVLNEWGDAVARPVIVALPRDGGAARTIPVTDAGFLRAVGGSMALGPDAALFAIHDSHAGAVVIRLDLASLEVSRLAIEGMVYGDVLWHEPTGGFALTTQSAWSGEGIEIVFRCGL